MNLLQRAKQRLLASTEDDIDVSALTGRDVFQEQRIAQQERVDRNAARRAHEAEIETLLRDGRAKLGQQLVTATARAKTQDEINEAQATFDRNWQTIMETTRRLYDPLTVNRIASLRLGLSSSSL